MHLLQKEVRGLHEAAYLLAFFTFGSQLFALVRDRLLAHQFGAGETLDIFYAAFRVPDTLYALLASVVSLFVLIPFLERAQQKGTKALRAFLSNMFTFFSGALIVCAFVAWIVTPQLVEFLYKGFPIDMQAQLVVMIRILLFQPFFLGVSNLCAAYVQMKGRFLLYAIAPILYNLGIIVGILFFYPIMGITGLAWGVVFGAMLHLGVQVPYLMQEKMLPRIVVPNWSEVKEVVYTSIPRTIALSTQQALLLFMVSLASLYAVGSVSSFSFAWNLQAVPLSIIGVSYSVAAFPKLARLFTRGDVEQFKKLILISARQIIFWALPAIVFVVVLRAQIVRVVLGTGEFGWDATRMTAAVLALLVISLVAQSLIVLLVRACYASGKTLAPLTINVSSAITTVLVTFLFLHMAEAGTCNLQALAELMRVPGVLSSEVLLIALAYSIGAIVNAVVLLLYFEVRYGSFSVHLFTTAWQSLIASLVAGFSIYLALNLLDDILLNDVVSTRTLIGVLVQGAVAGIVGACVWVVSLVALNNKDIVFAWTALQSKLKNTRIEEARGTIDSV
jgi:putative peptidoglycan lipid II flippase